MESPFQPGPSFAFITDVDFGSLIVETVAGQSFTASMDDAAREVMASRLRVAMSMMMFGYEMKRQQLRHRNPDADEDEIARRFAAWMNDRPMDGEGRVVSWPRPSRHVTGPT